MEGNKKRFRWKRVIIMGMALCLIFCLFKIKDMSNDILNLESQLGYYQSEAGNLRNEINAIYNNVDEQLKKEASLLSFADFTLGELDTTTHKVDVLLKVVPKNITEDMQLSVSVGDETADFTRNGNAFTATVPVNMFHGYAEYPILNIKTAEGIQTELLENVDVSQLHYQYLPVVSASMYGHSVLTGGKLKLSSDIMIECMLPDSDIAITKVELVTELNGKEVARKDVISKLVDGYGEFTIEEEYSAKPGDELLAYVVAEDSAGYVHKTLSHYWLDINETSSKMTTLDSSEYIYDQEGNLLNGLE